MPLDVFDGNDVGGRRRFCRRHHPPREHVVAIAVVEDHDVVATIQSVAAAASFGAVSRGKRGHDGVEKKDFFLTMSIEPVQNFSLVFFFWCLKSLGY